MPTSESTLSPWQVILGDRFTELHPRLRVYFDVISRGSVGVGDGVFDTVGSPRWWVRLFIRLAVDNDVMFPVWAKGVPFSVTNRAAVDASCPAVDAQRTFKFEARNGSGDDRVMCDRIMATPKGIVDVLGAQRRFRALFVTDVVDGALRLTSSRVALRIGRRHLIVPRWLSPTVTLTERFSDADERQHVALAMRAPLVGKVYEYAGSFRYEIRSEVD